MITITINDDNYPSKLKNIYDPPKKLYVLGDYKILNDFSIGIVGTRRCTRYGKNIAKSFSYNLAKEMNVLAKDEEYYKRNGNRNRYISTYWNNYGKRKNDSNIGKRI